MVNLGPGQSGGGSDGTDDNTTDDEPTYDDLFGDRNRGGGSGGTRGGSEPEEPDDDDGMSAREARWRDRLSDDDDDSSSSSGSSSSGSSSSSSSSSDDDDDWSRPSNPNQGESVTPDDDDDDSSGSPTRRRRGGGSTGTRGGTVDDEPTLERRQPSDPTAGIAAGLSTEAESQRTRRQIQRIYDEEAFQRTATMGTTLQEEEAETLTRATRRGGFLDEDQERAIRERTADLAERLDFEKDIENRVGGRVGGFLGGAGRLPAGLVQGGGALVGLTESGVETGQSLARGDVETGETADAVMGAAGEAARATAESAEEDPYSFAGELVTGAVLGSAAAKGLESAGDAARGARIARQSDRDTVELEDITSGEGAPESLAKFETDTGAPTREAVEEFRERADQNPEELVPTGSDRPVFHTTQQRLPGDLEIDEGASELPGLFTASEPSAIGLSTPSTSGGLSSIKPRTPRIRGETDEIVTLPGDDIQGMPASAQGAGYELRDVDSGEQVVGGLGRGEAKAMAADDPGVEVRPQQDTGGYQFLTEEAEPGTVNIRPTGSRTSELEGVIPPGSEFVEEGVTPVRVGRRQVPGTDIDIPGTGRTIPARRFRRVDDADADVESAAAALDDAADDIAAASDDAGDYLDVPTSSVTRRQGTPTGPPLGVTGGSPTPTDFDSTPSGASGTSTGPSDVTGTPLGTDPTSVGGGPSSGTPTGPPSGSPAPPSGTPFGDDPSGSPTGTSPTPSGGGSGSSPASGVPPGTPPGEAGPTPRPPDEEQLMADEVLDEEIEEVEARFDTGIADVEDLLGGD